MKCRLASLLTLITSLVAVAAIATPATAEESFGVITHVASESRKISFLSKGGTQLELEVPETAEILDAKSEKIKNKANTTNDKEEEYTLKDVADAVSKAAELGQKGVFARVSYKGTTATQIIVGFLKEKKPK